MTDVPASNNEEERRVLESLKNPSVVAQKFNQCMDYDSLKTQMCLFFKESVPCVFQSCEDAKDDECSSYNSLLIQPIEWYIFGGEPADVIEELKKSDNPSQLCGRVFKYGEPTYSCRDCALDPTCVLCIDCFKQSGHTKHRYKMNTSGGGGYCDCGDTEAWTSHPSCAKHLVSEQEAQDPLENFSEEIIRRASLVFQFLLNYCNTIINTDDQEVLPENLRPNVMNDSYTTMLYNDEIHTYDQVIDALKKAIHCKQKEGLEFATIVDKEGRTPVKNSSFRNCEEVKSIITNQSSRVPLKVLIMHSSVVAHQTFALKLMDWFIKISSAADGLRTLICQKLLSEAEGTDHTLAEAGMLKDSKLWKLARTQWHELFMSTMLLDTLYKKEFAILLANRYPKILSDFAGDDHDHSVSITSITVQVFTVPTLGVMLVREHSLLKVIVRAFLKCTEENRDDTGRYVFSRSKSTHVLRRILYSLTDLRYVLSNKPQVWDKQMRDKVMEGVEAFLDFLKGMHSMDPVVRVVGHHIEYDPEWETGIHLHMALKHCITLFIDWCCADRSMLVKAYRLTMKTFKQMFSKLGVEEVKFAGHTTSCFKYEVSHRVVSIHYAVSRFLAGLHLGLGKYRLNYFTEGLLSGPTILPIEMIEEALRVQVLVAELHAGMWRRNGYSLVNQAFFYKNVKCRAEMYDRDIQILQIGACLMEPDDFLICSLNRFELVDFVEIGGADSTHTQIAAILGSKTTVMEEYLHFLIILFSERYVVGVGEVEPTDGLRRDLLHLLCINSMSHSELVKNLPENYCHETGIEEVIPSLANYKKPTKVTEKGQYELKEECLQEYSPYYYHYTKSEQSKSEEHYREMVERDEVHDVGKMYIPHLPPPLCPNLQKLVKLLDCRSFITLLRLIFHRAVLSRGRIWSESMYQKALHLVGIALLEEERSLEEELISLNFTDMACKGTQSLLTLMQLMVGNPKVKSSTELINWILKKFYSIQKVKGTVPPGNDVVVDLMMTTIPKDKVKEEDERKRKAELAQKRRDHLMAQMSAMQKSFIRDNPEFFTGEEGDDEESRDRTGSISSMDVVTESGSHDINTAVGPNKGPGVFQEPQSVTCILCQEEEKISFSGNAMVYCTFVQRSSVLSNSRGKSVKDKFYPLFSGWDVYLGCHARTCGHVMHATCWQSFFEALVHKERRRVSRFRIDLHYDISKLQFLCPLCETLSNTVLPILPPLVTDDSRPTQNVPTMEEWLMSFDTILKSQITIQVSKKTSDITDQPSQLRSSSPEVSLEESNAATMTSGKVQIPIETDEMVASEGDSVDPPTVTPSIKLPSLLCPSLLWQERLLPNFMQLFTVKQPCSGEPISKIIQEMVKIFSQATYTIGLKVMPDSDNEQIPIMSWNACAYTIQSTEILLRSEQKPLFGSLPSRQCDTLRGLVRHAQLTTWLCDAAHIQRHVLRLLTVFYGTDIQTFGETPSILDIDVFTLMVSLVSSYSALFQQEDWRVGSTCRLNAPIMNLYILKLCFVVHLVQIILTAELDDSSDTMEQDDDTTPSRENLTQIFSLLRQHARPSTSAVVPQMWTILNHMKKACLPFLRCAALYFHFLTSVPYPEEMLESPGPESCELESLCRYLALPMDLSEMMDFSFSPVLRNLIFSVCSKPTFRETVNIRRHFPLKVNQLIPLPHDYLDLMNDRSLYVCPRAGATQSESRASAMCLLCGSVLCSQSYCCQVEIEDETVGACTAHALQCNEGSGLFLRVRECVLLLMASKNNSCSYVPPYVDEYGEPDQGLRRGNPLCLSLERYQELHKMWISHELPAEVTRRLESNNNLLNFQNI